MFMDFLSFPPADGVVLIDPEYLKERKGEKSAALIFPSLTELYRNSQVLSCFLIFERSRLQIFNQQIQLNFMFV